MSTDTPRTRAIEQAIPESAELCEHWHEMDAHANKLERELTEANFRAECYKSEVANWTNWRSEQAWLFEIDGYKTQLAAKDAEIARLKADGAAEAFVTMSLSAEKTEAELAKIKSYRAEDKRAFDALQVERNRLQMELDASVCAEQHRQVVAQLAAARLDTERLISAADVIAKIPIEEFGLGKKPERPLHGWNGHYINVGHVLEARAAIDAARREPQTKDTP